MCDVVPDAAFYLMPPTMSVETEKESFNVPYWAIRGSSDEEQVNLGPGNEQSASVVLKCQSKPKVTPYKEVSFPVLTNTVRLASGDEVLLYKAPKEDKNKGQPIAPEASTKSGRGRGRGAGKPAAKKARTTR